MFLHFCCFTLSVGNSEKDSGVRDSMTYSSVCHARVRVGLLWIGDKTTIAITSDVRYE